MGVGAVLNRVAIEGYDKRMGSKEEFDKFEQLRLVTKGAGAYTRSLLSST